MSRVYKRGTWQLHDCERAVIDEPRCKPARRWTRSLPRSMGSGRRRSGFTATPIDMVGMYDVLVRAGVNSELQCGALLHAITYAPDEPDYKALFKAEDADGNVSETQAKKLMPLR
ncbi:MAG: hypothetical protein U5N10_02265 [Gemmobacter sp.]|nr:hypothetical protein [Gemmobacter sp.]